MGPTRWSCGWLGTCSCSLPTGTGFLWMVLWCTRHTGSRNQSRNRSSMISSRKGTAPLLTSTARRRRSTSRPRCASPIRGRPGSGPGYGVMPRSTPLSTRAWPLMIYTPSRMRLFRGMCIGDRWRSRGVTTSSASPRRDATRGLMVRCPCSGGTVIRRNPGRVSGCCL